MPETPNSFEETEHIAKAIYYSQGWTHWPLDSIDLDRDAESVCEKYRVMARAAIASLSPQAAVGEGELPPRPPVFGDETVDELCEEWHKYANILTAKYREAIAQRDEAQVLEGWYQAEAALQRDRAEAAEAKLAALEVPKPESEEFADLDSAVRFLAAHVGWGEPHVANALRALTRLRSLPSEPAGKAGENET